MRAWRCKPLHLEVIDAKFLFELLMGLLAHPPRLDDRGEYSEGARRWEVRQLILLLAGRPTLADEPDLFVTWEVLVRAFSGAGRRSVWDANSHRRERRPERSFGAAPPCDGPPLLQLKRVLRRERPDIRAAALAAPRAR